MDRPSVTIHNTISLDGRLTAFPVDLGLHYEVAGRLPGDAILTGSGTLLAAARAEGVDMSGADRDEPVHASAADDPRPWLVVVDSRGRLTRLGWLRGQPFWRDVLICCSESTPAEHRARLVRHQVEHIVAGTDRVHLATVLQLLAGRYAVRAVRVDAGGALNGQLLRADLVDEISLIVAPHLAGTDGGHPVPLLSGPAPTGASLTLIGTEPLRDGHLWLRYSTRESTT
jgi:2,5-diamino-6-(ribosylamino)-4(3H)-pyrimidinone 5'-phosphate reductase